MEDKIREKYSKKVSNIIIEQTNDFVVLFPYLFTKDEIYKRIIEQVDDIVFTEDFTCNAYGEYKGLTKIIKIRESLAPERQMVTIFHELMVHALSTFRETDELIIGTYDYKKLTGRCLNESIATLIELKYFKYKYGHEVKSINNYVSNYAKQLEIIYGESFLRQFYTKQKSFCELFSTSVSSLFTFFTSPAQLMYKDLARDIDSVFALISTDNDNAVHLKNTEIEQTIFSLLINKNDITLSEKLQKIAKLYSCQITPSWHNIISFINVNKPDLTDYPYFMELMDVYNIIKEDNYSEIDALDNLPKKKYNSQTIKYICEAFFHGIASKTYYENMRIYESIITHFLEGTISLTDIKNSEIFVTNNRNDFNSNVKYQLNPNGVTKLHQLLTSKTALINLKNDNKDVYIELCDEESIIYLEKTIDELANKLLENIPNMKGGIKYLIDLLEKYQLETVFINDEEINNICDNYINMIYKKDGNEFLIKIEIEHDKIDIFEEEKIILEESGITLLSQKNDKRRK